MVLESGSWTQSWRLVKSVIFTKGDKKILESVTGITKFVWYYKVWQKVIKLLQSIGSITNKVQQVLQSLAKNYCKVWQALQSVKKQSVTDIIKCDNYYKFRRNTGHKFGIGSLRYVKQIQILVLWPNYRWKNHFNNLFA